MVTYELGNVADWLSAIGTISAVVVALYLSRKEAKPRAKVTSKFSYTVDMHYGVSEEPINISVEIVNQGLVPIFLTECTVRVDRNNRLSFRNGDHRVQKLLNPGEFYEHVLDYNQLKKYFIQNNIYRINTYVYFIDATGKKYKSKTRFNFSKAS